MEYKLHVTFLYYSVFGKYAVANFKGGNAKRRLKKGVKQGLKKGIETDFKIVEIGNGNVKWELKSSDLDWLKRTRNELTNGVNEKFKELTGKPIFESVRKIKTLGIGAKVTDAIVGNLENAAKDAKEHFDVSFEFFKDGDVIEV